MAPGHAYSGLIRANTPTDTQMRQFQEVIPKILLADSWGIERSRYSGAHIEIL
jgi:hypothetical protein